MPLAAEHAGHNALGADLRQVGLLQPVLLHEKCEHVDGTGIRNRIAPGFVCRDEIADAFHKHCERRSFVRAPGVRNLVKHGD